jgi:hypothetical protein
MAESRRVFTRVEQFFLRELVKTPRDSVMPLWQSARFQTLKTCPTAPPSQLLATQGVEAKTRARLSRRISLCATIGELNAFASKT